MESSSSKIRSFISVDIEEPELLQSLIGLQREIRGLGVDVKAVERENLHFTLRFLGELPPQTLDALSKDLTTLALHPFKIHLKGLGAFPNLRRINVIWVGVVEGGEKLIDIAHQVEGRAANLGLPPDPKGFKPHLTIARVKSGRNMRELTSFLEARMNLEVGSGLVNALRLKKSTLTPRGPIYETILQVPALNPPT